jgi:protein tyrosine phosphatase
MNFKVLSLAQMITYVDSASKAFCDKIFDGINENPKPLQAINRYIINGQVYQGHDSCTLIRSKPGIKVDVPHVVLKQCGIKRVEWNATLMEKAYPNIKVYASQAPYGAHNVPTFMQMVFDLGIKFIITVGDPAQAEGDGNYTRYFPTNPGEALRFDISGNQTKEYTVTLTSQQEVQGKRGKFFINTLQFKGNDQELEVQQFYFQSWPNKDVPQDFQLVSQFVQTTHQQVFATADPESPILIHCNAGVGRTGTFMALERIFATQERGADGVIKIINSLREDRPAVEHLTQQEFIATFAHNLDVHTPRPTTVEAPSPSRLEVALAALKQIARETLKPSILAVVLVHMMQRAEEFGARSA